MSKTDKATEGSPVSLGFKVRELLTGLRSGARKSAGPGAFFYYQSLFFEDRPPNNRRGQKGSHESFNHQYNQSKGGRHEAINQYR